MGDAQDLQDTLQQLADSIKALQATAEANAKAIVALNVEKPSSSGSKTSTGDSHPDRPPPRFQKLDFPKYDGKTDRSSSLIDANRTSISNGS
jgi:hypothetical protein